mmetsp:Transcript_771/g.1605  ORF Transcript_771/g.1605 Transcript_771/m.1605 type:complete len:86 (-) Transcript_771:575-832(-)
MILSFETYSQPYQCERDSTQIVQLGFDAPSDQKDSDPPTPPDWFERVAVDGYDGGDACSRCYRHDEKEISDEPLEDPSRYPSWGA